MPPLDWLLFTLDGWFDAIRGELANRGWLGLLLFGFPFLILVEAPRYAIPAIMVMLRRKREQIPAVPPAGLGCSVLLVGYNEHDQMPRSIEQILRSDVPVDEIVVVDDGSEDGTWAAAQRFREDPRVKIYRNSGASGRGGRPSASNLALMSSRQPVVISVDADTRLQTDCIRHLLAHFHDPEVGAVAGCLVVDRRQSFLASLQSIEFLVTFGMHRRWLDDHGMSVMASGALGAFRREAIQRVGAWDPELAEDADISTKVRKAGWKLRFEARAIAETDIPQTWSSLLRQRRRWDRGFIRTFFRKHNDILNPWRYGWRRSGELLMEGFLSVACSLLLPVYIAWLALTDARLLAVVLILCVPIYTLVIAFSLSVALSVTNRWREDWPLLLITPVFPIYGWILRVTRIWAYALELLRVDYEDPFLPQSAWRHAPRW